MDRRFCLTRATDDPPIVNNEQCAFGISEFGCELQVANVRKNPGFAAPLSLQAILGNNEWTPRTGRDTEDFTTEPGDMVIGKFVDFGSERPVDTAAENPGSTFPTKSISPRRIGVNRQSENASIIRKSHDRSRGYDAAPTSTSLSSNSFITARPPPSLVSRSCYQGGATARSFSSPPRPDVCLARVPVCSSSVKLDDVISFGDFLSIMSDDRLTRVGATGGFMGHVLLVTSRPMCVNRYSPEAFTFQRVWPHLDVTCIWLVPVIESTRSVTGLHESACLLYSDPKSGSIIALGDLVMSNDTMEIGKLENGMLHSVQIFCCPAELRNLADETLMRQALADLRQCDASWSWATAVRAFLLEGELTAQDGSDGQPVFDGTLEDIQACWTAEPICTSVVIIFWQRYLCYLVEHAALPDVGNDALSAILQYMPLKADRALPGELMAVLRSRKWKTIARVPLGPKENHLMRIASI